MATLPVSIDAADPTPYAVNRATCILSDGRAVTATIKNIAGTTDLEIAVTNADRTAVTSTATFSGGYNPSYYSITVGPDDRLHLLYSLQSGNALYYKKFNRSGNTYVDGGSGVAIQTPSGSNYYGRRDIEVLDSGVLVVMAHAHLPGQNPPSVDTKVFTSVDSGGSWSNVWNDNAPITTPRAGPAHICTIARDAGGASGGYQYVAYAYQRNPRDYSMQIGTFRIQIATGQLDQHSNLLSVPNEQKYFGYQGLLFSAGANEWVLPVSLGHLNSATAGQKLGAYKFSRTAILGQAPLALMPDLVNASDVVQTFQSFGYMPGRLLAFTAGNTGNAATSGIRGNICRVNGNSLSWGPRFSFANNVGYTFLRSGGNRNFSNRYVDCLSSRVSDRVTFLATPNAPAAPTAVRPGNGSISLTSRPSLGATLPVGMARHRGEWQMASDAGFTTAVKTITESESDLRASGQTLEDTPLTQALTQGDRYVRARTINEFGIVGPWSASNLFTVTHPPQGKPVQPIENQTVSNEGYNLIWKFLDTFTDDVQTAYQVMICKVDDESVIHDSGKVISSADNHTIGGPILADLNTLLQWTVRVWDSDDVVGPFSNMSQFTIAQSPSIVLTAPANGSTIDNPMPSIEWTFTSGSGAPQQRVIVAIAKKLEDGSPSKTEILSWIVAGDAASTQPPEMFFENNTEYFVAVSAYDTNGLVTNESVVLVETEWTPPSMPPFTVDIQQFSGEGFVQVLWNDQVQDPDFSGYRVYRRSAGSNNPRLIFEVSEAQEEYDFHDWLAPSNYTSEWTVVQLANRFGAIVESDRLWDSQTPNDDYYWLIGATDSQFNVRLSNVTGHDWSDEYEQEELVVIGRGTHVDRGSFIGQRGSITAQVWDWQDMTARERRLKVQGLREANIDMYIRDPFGDVLRVVPGNIGFARIPGVATREFHTLTIPYSETYDDAST